MDPVDWDDVLDDIDRMIAPEYMGPDEALEALERLSYEIEVRIGGLKDDISSLTDR